MISNDTLIKVKNRDNGTVGYTIPEMGNLRREFTYREEKNIPMEELRKLVWLRGGKKLLKEYLIIDNEEAVAELLGEVEPEYNYTEEDVRELLLNGSLDAFLDCLDYAPEGVISLIKKLAVELEVNDIAKREAILKSTGFNVTAAININKEDAEAKQTDDAPKQRRVQSAATTASEPEKVRRTAAPSPREYKVVSTTTENK